MNSETKIPHQPSILILKIAYTISETKTTVVDKASDIQSIEIAFNDGEFCFLLFPLLNRNIKNLMPIEIIKIQRVNQLKTGADGVLID